MREAARDVGVALWPSLGRELCSARNELEVLLDELHRDPVRLLRDESRLAQQEHTGLRSRRAGWSLGVLAAAHGIDLLRERRAPDGLRWIVGDLVAARALELAPGPAELPTVVSRTSRAWEVCLLAAWCVLKVGESADGTVRWRAAERDATWSLAFAVGVRPLAQSCTALLESFRDDLQRVDLSSSELVLSWH